MSVGDAEEEAMAIVHSLRALTVDLNVAVSGFANKYTMHSTDVRALICLLDAERSDTPATPGWLGAQLGINSASVTALVDRMVKAGHVARERDSADRRRVLLQVTPTAVQAEHHPALAEAAVRALGRIDLPVGAHVTLHGADGPV
ncbi:MarR family transcriptional regulator, partial [Streptomyces sp. NPDC002130]|uniref:MarR family winged helix-turn-helix transcriptional regulator n=1 Tax=Streptomyces sp. NPDC002130 TaxID=3155568 RepID=UPI00332ECFE6